MFTNDTAAIFDAKARAVRAYHLMQWARWATFCLYIVAVFMLYVSDVWGIASFIVVIGLFTTIHSINEISSTLFFL